MPYKNREDRLASCKRSHQRNRADRIADMRVYYLINKEKKLKADKSWRDANVEEIKKRRKLYRAKSKDVQKIRSKAYYENNKEMLRLKSEEYRAANRESLLAKARAKNTKTLPRRMKWWREYFPKNKDRILAKQKEYHANNPEMRRFHSNKRRALKSSQIHPKCDFSVIKKIHDQARRLANLHGIRHSVDHIIPLARGGWHHHDNLSPLPSSLNASKHANPYWTSPSPDYKDWRDVPTYLWPEKLVPGFLARLLLD